MSQRPRFRRSRGLRPVTAVALSVLGVLTPVAQASAQSAGPWDALVSATTWDAAISAFAVQVAADVEADGVGGITAGVMVDGDLVWARGFGLADREAGTPMSASAISRTGSISKSITAVLMLRLVDQGLISLDDPVEAYLPEVTEFTGAPAGGGPVTFRQLASHTAGLDREPDWPDAVVGPLGLWEERILSSIPRTAFYAPPGSGYRYSNIGFGTLGLALSRAAGRPFIELIHEEIFTPLGMTGSTFAMSELESRVAKGYVVSRDGEISGEQPAREHAGRGYKVPNGGVYSTVADLGRFMGAMCGVAGLDILSEEQRAGALTVQTPEDPMQGYGLGFSVQVDEEGRTLAGHGGSVAGYTAHMRFDPDACIGVILLRNYGRGATNLGAAAASLVRTLRERPLP